MWEEWLTLYLLYYLLFDHDTLPQAPLHTMLSQRWLDFCDEVSVDVRSPFLHRVQFWKAVVQCGL